MRRIVSNTGPLLHLTEAQALDLLALTGEVHIPKAVDLEMAQQVATWKGQKRPWLKVDILSAPHKAKATLWQKAGLLDPGEAEAIALAEQLHADWLLTDDATARLFAQALGIEVHGSLGVILWAAATAHLEHDEVGATLERLARSSLWISAEVLAEARAALDQLFSHRDL